MKKKRPETPKIDLDSLMDKNLNLAFQEALEKAIRSRAKKHFKKALRNGSALGKQVDARCELFLRQFLEMEKTMGKVKAGKP